MSLLFVCRGCVRSGWRTVDKDRTGRYPATAMARKLTSRRVAAARTQT